jgi:hypothetical protein
MSAKVLRPPISPKPAGLRDRKGFDAMVEEDILNDDLLGEDDSFKSSNAEERKPATYETEDEMRAGRLVIAIDFGTTFTGMPFFS